MRPSAKRRLRRTLSAVQQRLASYYQLEGTLEVADYVREGAPGSRETLLLRESSDHLELCLVLPPELSRLAGGNDNASLGQTTTDEYLQLVEGISHFMLVVERARIGLPTTQLELELQAEVDKFVVLAVDGPTHTRKTLHQQLYERVSFLHAAHTELGARYRLANGLAARFVHHHLAAQPGEQQQSFRRFYRAGQAEKIRLVGARRPAA